MIGAAVTRIRWSSKGWEAIWRASPRARASAAPTGGTTLQFSAKNSFAARPALSFIVTLSPRWAFYAGGGVLFVDPEIGLATLDAAGRTVRTETGTWKANSVVWGVGIGRSIF